MSERKHAYSRKGVCVGGRRRGGDGGCGGEREDEREKRVSEREYEGKIVGVRVCVCARECMCASVCSYVRESETKRES